MTDLTDYWGHVERVDHVMWSHPDGVGAREFKLFPAGVMRIGGATIDLRGEPLEQHVQIVCDAVEAELLDRMEGMTIDGRTLTNIEMWAYCTWTRCSSGALCARWATQLLEWIGATEDGNGPSNNEAEDAATAAASDH